MWISDPGKGISCAGSFAYRKSILEKTWYSENAANGEEISFTDFYTLPTTELDPFKTMICISHPGNTFDKRILRDNLEGGSFKLQSGENVLGQESFFKIERNAKGNKESTDWKFGTSMLAGEIKLNQFPTCLNYSQTKARIRKNR